MKPTLDAIEALRRATSHLDRSPETAEMLDRAFDAPHGRFDWQAYVPTEISDLWGSLSAEGQLVAFLYASMLAEDDYQ